jgi:biotin operon repressor
MSVRQIGWAVSRKGLKTLDKLVLIILADRADKDGWSFMAQATIAKQAGASRRSVLDAMQRLSEFGLIVRVQRQRPGGGRTSDHIRILTSNRCADFSQPPVQDLRTIPSPSYEVAEREEERGEEGRGLAVRLRVVGGSAS